MDETDTVDQEAEGWTRGRIVGVSAGVALAAAVIGLLVAGLVNRDQELSIDRRIAENKAPLAPPVALPVLVAADGIGPEGATVSLDSLRGKTVVVNLWASWCGPCRSEAPILERLADTYRPRGVVILGINVRDGSRSARAFLEDVNLSIPSLRDGTDRTERRLESLGIPETLIVDPDGKMRFNPIRGELTQAGARDVAAYLDEVLAP